MSALRTVAGNPAPSALWLLAAAGATLAPHALHLPIWISALCALLLGAWVVLVWRNASPPRQALTALLAAACGLGVKLEFGIFFGKDPGIALLALLLTLKLLECRSARDVRAAILLSFFLQLSLFLYDQTPIVATLAIGGTLLAAATLVSLQDTNAPPSAHLRTSGVLLAQGLPFMVLLFFLFPRIQGPLWGLPADAYSGITGLSDSMTPGSIAELGLSDAIAFRAAFEGPPPPPSQRYWRGPVLTHFDGRSWRQAPTATLNQVPYDPIGRGYDYVLTLEPHNQNWVLALDYPASAPEATRLATDYRLLARTPVRARTRVALRAHPNTQPGRDETRATLYLSQRLPDGFNPRARALARELAADGAPPAAVLERVLQHLRATRLIYTLSPPLLGTHSVDEFLFDTKSGFCEHFAAAFVVLMRAAGVPARVVTGYQGGELNPFDGALVVRQSDAHAWAEVWLAERGWVRVDPTALAAPERIQSGLGAALPAGDARPFLLRPGLEWLREMRHRWDALSNTWNQWVLGYNPERQREALARLGFHDIDWRTYGALLGGSIGTLMLLLLAWAARQHQRQDPLERSWQRFSGRCGSHGAPRQAWEGPLDYGARLARIFPAHADELQEIARRYARLRYSGGRRDREAERELAARIRRLRFK